MIITEWNEDEYREVMKEEAREEGLAEGLAEGIAEGLAEGFAEGEAQAKQKIARGMKEEGIPPDVIIRVTGLEQDFINQL